MLLDLFANTHSSSRINVPTYSGCVLATLCRQRLVLPCWMDVTRTTSVWAIVFHNWAYFMRNYGHIDLASTFKLAFTIDNIVGSCLTFDVSAIYSPSSPVPGFLFISSWSRVIIVSTVITLPVWQHSPSSLTRHLLGLAAQLSSTLFLIFGEFFVRLFSTKNTLFHTVDWLIWPFWRTCATVSCLSST